MLHPLLLGLGTTELLIIVGVIVLLFGASKLPDLARGSGQALRIFKAETKGLIDEDKKTPEQLEIEKRETEQRESERRAEREHGTDAS